MKILIDDDDDDDDDHDALPVMVAVPCEAQAFAVYYIHLSIDPWVCLKIGAHKFDGSSPVSL